ncbi:MAG: crossover junction endodeoxyribonuclease RuvC [Oscillospiraceae bacterium]|nr:crossover junction endodeoxyribonuclease RuvC [Oscillospiraceae bacterium]
MTILGIDPGYALIGYAVIETENIRNYILKTCGVIRTSSELNFFLRLEEIYERMNIILNEFSPDIIAIESIYFQNNQKTAIAVAHARGIIILSAQKLKIPIYEFTPLQVKKTLTGYGKATKQQIMLMTKKILNLTNLPKQDDAADALAIAICGSLHKNNFKMAKKRVDANYTK